MTPGFVLLAGLAAALRQQRRGEGPAATAGYLVRRGLLLVLLELTLVNFGWTFQFPPGRLFLQVIWAIGLSLIALAGLVVLPSGLVLGLSLLIVLGHDLLTPIQAAPGSWGFVPWAILHDRSLIPITSTLTARTSYPVLPYVGVIGLGYSLGRLYQSDGSPQARRRLLLGLGTAALLVFGLLRPLNLYGERGPFVPGDSALASLASLLNTTKYPPSPLFLLMTLGPVLIALGLAERWRGRLTDALAEFGAAPMLFYVLHIYGLHLVNRLVAWQAGTEGLYSFDHVSSVWLTTAVALAVFAPLTVGLAWLQRRRRAGSARPEWLTAGAPAGDPR